MITTVNLNFAGRDDLTTQSRNDLDVRLLGFVKTQVNSFVKLDLLNFFNKNRHTAATVENIARYIGRKTEAVEPELIELVKAGLVEQQRVNDQPVYVFTPNETRRTLVNRFLMACEDRHFRIKAVEYMIRGIR